MEHVRLLSKLIHHSERALSAAGAYVSAAATQIINILLRRRCTKAGLDAAIFKN